MMLHAKEHLSQICADAARNLPRIDDEEMAELVQQYCRGLVQLDDLITETGKEQYESFPTAALDATPFGTGPTWYEMGDEDEEDDEMDEEEEEQLAELAQVTAELEEYVEED